jgi:hypothetical protein
MLPLGGPRVKQAEQRGIYVSKQHLFQARGKALAGCRTLQVQNLTFGQHLNAPIPDVSGGLQGC